MSIKKNLLGIIFTLGIVALLPSSVKAANGVEIKDDTVSIDYQKAKAVNISYTGNFSDLKVVVGDSSVILTNLTDNGNGSATLSIGSIDFGKTVLAVCKSSDTSAVDYLYVNSGLTTGYEIKNYFSGTNITTVYSDCVIKYNLILNGANNEKATFKTLNLTRENGLDKLNVTADIVNDNTTLKGLSKYTASFYDVTGALIKTQDAYVRSDLNLSSYNMCWYIPSNCVKIVLN